LPSPTAPNPPNLVRHGPVTLLGQDRDGSLSFVAADYKAAASLLGIDFRQV
jgi:hypothetical protein